MLKVFLWLVFAPFILAFWIMVLPFKLIGWMFRGIGTALIWSDLYD